jgi:hypothetical protein
VRICSQNANRDKRLGELKNVIIQRGYPEKLINRGIEKAGKNFKKNSFP